MTIGARLLYALARGIFTLVFRVHFRAQIEGVERVPRNGALLLLANHISFADPPFIGWALPRYADYLALTELFRIPLLGRAVRAVGAFPVDRDRVDHRAAREAIRRLRSGRCLLMFPEGGIRLGPRSVLGGQPEIKPGAVIIAELGACPIQPVIVRDTRRLYDWRNWLRRPTVSVTFGFPFCLWSPPHVPAAKRRKVAQETVREQMLETVERC